MSSKILKNLTVLFFVMIFSGLYSYSQLVSTVISITGSVYDASTRQPISAIMIVTDETGKRINATRSNGTDNGYYFITGLKPGKKYTLTISSKFYLKETYEFEITDAYRYTELSRDFLVMPLQKDALIPLSFPPFELNKSRLRYGADYVLDGIKGTMLNNPNVKFEIICYPDSEADKNENATLTAERAGAIAKYLIANGVDKSRISTKSNKSVDPNNPPPKQKKAKGKRYIGSTYIKIIDV